jgi:hypothetical protein
MHVVCRELIDFFWAIEEKEMLIGNNLLERMGNILLSQKMEWV